MLEGMTKATRMGFGMPAPGSKQPAIFISAIAAGLEGTFRSLDGGQSWIRVDDKDHQFGWKNAVIGDPRVFGRLYLATGGRGIIYGDPQQAPATATSATALNSSK
jgi:xyloglucan-specific exo-beta-1,4-glucanase